MQERRLASRQAALAEEHAALADAAARHWRLAAAAPAAVAALGSEVGDTGSAAGADSFAASPTVGRAPAPRSGEPWGLIGGEVDGRIADAEQEEARAEELQRDARCADDVATQ
eukprot:361162-Chlamydomonas_euryale.AAC.1